MDEHVRLTMNIYILPRLHDILLCYTREDVLCMCSVSCRYPYMPLTPRETPTKKRSKHHETVRLTFKLCLNLRMNGEEFIFRVI